MNRKNMENLKTYDEHLNEYHNSNIEEVEDDELLDAMKEKTGERTNTKDFLKKLRKKIKFN